MFHPLTPNLTQLSDEELSTKMNDLTRKFNIASRSNFHLANQMQNMLDDYRAEYSRRQIEKDKEAMAQMDDEDWFSEKIDIN